MTEQTPADGSAAVAPRLFALAMVGRPELMPFDDAAAEFYRSCGYSGVFFENDHNRFGQPATYGSWRNINEALSLWRFSRDETAQLYLEWLSQGVATAHRNGLRVYLKAWEPRVPMSLRDQLPPAVRSNLWDEIPNNVCLTAPGGEKLIREYHIEALERLPPIDGLIIGVDDNWAELCSDSCPHCGRLTYSERVMYYWALVHDVVATARPGLDIILYDWLWKERDARDAIVTGFLQKHSGDLRVITRFAQGMRQRIPGYEGPGDGVHDCTLIVDGPGPTSQRYRPWVEKGRLRLLDAVPPGQSMEIWAHPYLPAPALLFRRLKALEEYGFEGFTDYDCSTPTPGIAAEAIAQYMRGDAVDDIDAFLDALARNTYGADSVRPVRNAWSLCEDAIRAYPLDMSSPRTFHIDSRFGPSMALTIGMVPELEKFADKDYHGEPHFMYPYSVLVSDLIEAQVKQLDAAATGMEEGARCLSEIAAAVEQEHREFAQTEANRALALALSLRSQHNWAQMAQAVYDEKGGRKRIPKDWFREAFQRERDLTARYAELYRNDRTLFSNPTWDEIGIVQLCQPQRQVDRDRPFDDKIAILDKSVTAKKSTRCSPGADLHRA